MESPEKDASAGSSLGVLFRDSTVYAIGRIALSALDLLLLPLYTRVLLPDALGVIALGAAFMAAVLVVAPFGMDTALGRFFFDHREGSREQRAVVGTLLVAMAFIALLIACGLSVAAPWLARGLLEDLSPTFLVILVWSAFFGVFVAMWLQLLQLRREPRRYVGFALGQAVVRGALTLLLVWMLGRGPVGWAEAYLVTNVLAGGAAILFVRKEILLVVHSRVLRDAMKYALPVVIHQIAGWTTTFASRFILNQLATLRAVGVFQVAFGIGQVLSLMVTSFNFAYAPRFMAAATRDGDSASTEFGAMATYYLAAVVGVALLVSVFAEDIVALVAPGSYGEAAGLVPIIAATFVMQGAYYLHANVIFFSKVLTRALPLITVGGALANIAATYAMVPRFGILGAAWAGLVTNMLVVAGAYWLARRALKLRYDARKITIFSVASVLLLLASEWLSTLAPHHYQRIGIRLASALVYVMVLWTLGIVRPAALYCTARDLVVRRGKPAE